MMKKNKLLNFIAFVIALLISSCKTDNNLKDPLQAGWKGKKVCTILEENDKIRALKCVFPPGVGHEKHFHAAHFAYTLSGSRFRMTDATGRREVNVPKGYNYFKEKVEWHKALNIGDSTAVFLIIEPK